MLTMAGSKAGRQEMAALLGQIMESLKQLDLLPAVWQSAQWWKAGKELEKNMCKCLWEVVNHVESMSSSCSTV